MIRAAALLALLIATPASAQPPYTDAELVEGFSLTVFGAEVRETEEDDAAAARVKKFPGPVRYRIISTGEPDWRRTVRGYLKSLSQSVAHLDIIEAERPDDAQMTIYLVDRADYVPTIRRTVWGGVHTGFLEENACSAVIAARTTGIERANVYLVADEGFLSLSHCMVEEIAQSLGPANDSDELPDSIFNDASLVNVFGVFDWFILNMLYDPRIIPGMTEDDVLPLLPAVIADARARLPEVMAKDTVFAAHRRMGTLAPE